MSFYQRYNFVFFHPICYGCTATDIHYEDAALFELNKLTNVRFIKISPRAFINDNGFYVQCEPIHTIQNPHVFHRPVKNLAFGNYFEKEFSNNDPIIFSFYWCFYLWMKPLGYFNYLRKIYPNCKLVLKLTDPISDLQKRCGMFATERSVNELRSTFDGIITYIHEDAMKFDLLYSTGNYSILPIEKQEEIYDIFFIGAAKDRLNKIHSYYEYFRDNGFKCNFYVTNVPLEKQKFPGEIHYNQGMSYLDNLICVMRSKGVLEVSQSNNYGLTMRYFEALVYDKNFITDNGFFYQEKFLSSPKLFYIPPYSKLNIDREKFLAVSKFSNNYKGEYSPVRYLEFLEAYFNSRR